jgi:hypothetical protein
MSDEFCSTTPPSWGTIGKSWQGPASRMLEPDFIDFDIIREWIEYCEQSHPQCKPPLVVPLKLINCQTRSLEYPLHHQPYCALSYVWGSFKSEHDENSSSRLALPSSLPATIEDAIKTTLSLHLKYLWIDRYCINQHRDDEKAQEIGRMDQIYRGAQVVLFAIGPDPTYGLPGMSRVRTPPPSLQLEKHLLVGTPDECITDSLAGIFCSSWTDRAWTYQESAMATRRLFFTNRQVYFECGIHSHRESMLNPSPLDEINTSRAIRNAHSRDPEYIEGLPMICRHIQEYTMKMLTHPSDFLKAMLGILHYFQALSNPIHHYWGVPILPHQPHRLQDEHGNHLNSSSALAGFLRGLCWMPWHLPELWHTGLRRPQFPSWSWSGWDMWPNRAHYDCGNRDLYQHSVSALNIMHDGTTIPWEDFWAMMSENNVQMPLVKRNIKSTTQNLDIRNVFRIKLFTVTNERVDCPLPS